MLKCLKLYCLWQQDNEKIEQKIYKLNKKNDIEKQMKEIRNINERRNNIII